MHDGNGFISLKAILKYRYGSLPQSKLSRELAKQAVITKCRGKINAEPAVSLFKIKPRISVPKNNLCKSVIICGQKKKTVIIRAKIKLGIKSVEI